MSNQPVEGDFRVKDGVDEYFYQGEWKSCDLRSPYERGRADMLEQCLAWIKANLMENDFRKGYTYLYDPELEFKFEVDKVVENLRAAMRPQQQEENS